MFLTVDNKAGGRIELRRFGDGQVARTLVSAPPTDTISAARTRDGSIMFALSATADGCHTRIERLDPVSGRITRLGVIRDVMSQIAPSPDGRLLAYVTYPSCQAATPPTCAGVCNGPARFLPNTVGLLDLRSGKTIRTATTNPGNPVTGLSWSPDGRFLAVAIDQYPRGVVIMSPHDLRLAIARRLPSPAGCVYSAPSWTTAGIVVAQTCRGPANPTPVAGLGPDRMLLVGDTGAVIKRWPLPACIDGVTTATAPPKASALAELDIGAGNGRCGKSLVTRIQEVTRAGIHTVASVAERLGQGPTWLVAG